MCQEQRPKLFIAGLYFEGLAVQADTLMNYDMHKKAKELIGEKEFPPREALCERMIKHAQEGRTELVRINQQLKAVLQQLKDGDTTQAIANIEVLLDLR